MTEANPADLVDSIVIEEPRDQSLLSIPNVISSTPPLDSTKPKETFHTNLESAYMNVAVVDNTMQNLFYLALPPSQFNGLPNLERFKRWLTSKIFCRRCL